jgi:hypothetical protein
MAKTIEEILERFLFLFLKHLNIELTHLMILTNHQQLPKKSILRKSLPLNQNNAALLTQQTESPNRSKVLFTHIDSFIFDPRIPCQFLNQPQREPLNVSNTILQCLCHRNLKTNHQNKYKRQPK